MPGNSHLFAKKRSYIYKTPFEWELACVESVLKTPKSRDELIEETMMSKEVLLVYLNHLIKARRLGKKGNKLILVD